MTATGAADRSRRRARRGKRSATRCSTSAARRTTTPRSSAIRRPMSSTAPELAAFARASFPPRRPLVAAAIDLMHRIHASSRSIPASTTITTPVTRVLADRHGVCQDFAHLQIACLRSLGLPARYVSGYLLTDPPPGQPRLVGADASHAWLSVHCPRARMGRSRSDQRRRCRDQRHVTLAWGRDYGDVSPLRGVVLGGARAQARMSASASRRWRTSNVGGSASARRTWGPPSGGPARSS